MSIPPKTLEWIGEHDGHLRLLDQTRLPGEVTYRDCRSVEDVWEAIRSLRVRGAPAIGVAAAFGVILGLRTRDIDATVAYLRTSRPTAVNLFWALDRMAQGAADAHPDRLASELLVEAKAIRRKPALHSGRVTSSFWKRKWAAKRTSARLSLKALP